MVKKTWTEERHNRVIILIVLNGICFLTTLFANISLQIGAEYTHLFYIPIILTGLWFHKKAFVTAGFLGATHIIVRNFMLSSFDFSTIVCTFFFLFVAAMVSRIAEKMDMLSNQLLVEKEKAKLLNESIQDIIGRVDADGIVRYISPSVEKLLGYTVSERTNRSIYELIHPDDREIVKKNFLAAVTAGAPVSLEFRCVTKDGSYPWFEALLNPIVSEYFKKTMFMFSCRDMSRHKADEEVINNVAVTDPLTGLKNRRFLDAVLEKEMARANRYNLKMSVIMIDLDHFKLVNDTYGHPVGDQVLIRTAEITKYSLRRSDVIARLGGEEFIILLPETDVFGAFIVAEKIRKALEAEEHPVAGRITASFGIAERYRDESINDLYKRVDDALYLAKERGRNRVAVFENHEERPIAYVRLDWNPAMESGETTIDEQHRRILKIANNLISSTLSRSSNEDISNKLDELLNSMEEHFQYEEKAQRDKGFPNWSEHAAVHRELTRKAANLKQSFDEGTIKVSDLFSFMVDDLVYGHMMTEDTKFFPYFCEGEHVLT